jgi:hypothetical protein
MRNSTGGTVTLARRSSGWQNIGSSCFQVHARARENAQSDFGVKQIQQSSAAKRRQNAAQRTSAESQGSIAEPKPGERRILVHC